MRALVVDDSRTIRQILRRILEESGFAVTEAANGDEALAYLQKEPPPSVGLIDWDMPGMDGLALVEEIRRVPATTHMRLIMVTKRNGVEQIDAAREAGADEFLEKPFSREALIAKLALVGVTG